MGWFKTRHKENIWIWERRRTDGLGELYLE